MQVYKACTYIGSFSINNLDIIIITEGYIFDNTYDFCIKEQNLIFYDIFTHNKFGIQYSSNVIPLLLAFLSIHV